MMIYINFKVCSVSLALAFSHLRHSAGERLPNIESFSRVQLLTENDVSAAFNGHIIALISRTIYWRCEKHIGLINHMVIKMSPRLRELLVGSRNLRPTLSSIAVSMYPTNILAFSYEDPVDVGLRGEVQAAARVSQVREALKHEAVMVPLMKVESVFEGDGDLVFDARVILLQSYPGAIFVINEG